MEEKKLPSNEQGLASFASFVSALANRPQVTNVWFNDETVTLDGYSFRSCRFDNCELNVASTNFEIDKCFFDDKTVVVWRGEIIKVLRLFNRDSTRIYENLPKFAPERHENGTISIVF